VSNLNSNFLQSSTWDSPLPIGSTVPSTGAFTSISINGATSGIVSILTQSVAGTFNFNLPTSGNILLFKI